MKKGARKESSLEREKKFLEGELIECRIHGWHDKWYKQTYKPTGAIYLSCSHCALKQSAQWRQNNTFRVLYTNAKGNSNRKLREGRGEFGVFDIDEEYIRQLFIDQNMRCALTGVIFDRRVDGPGGISVDRIDSGKGYVKGNVQLVLNEINSMKKEFKQSRFIALCRLVANFHRKEDRVAFGEQTGGGGGGSPSFDDYEPGNKGGMGSGGGGGG